MKNDKIVNIPKPKKTNIFDKLVNGLKRVKTLNDLKEHIDNPLEEPKIRFPSKFIVHYLTAIILFFVEIGGLIILLLKAKEIGFIYPIILMLYLLIISPICICILFYILIRLYIDRFPIKQKIKKVIKGGSLIIAHFFMPNKKLLTRYESLDTDSSFLDSGGRYIIDEKKILFDENGYAHGFWISNLPNQVSFRFDEFFKDYFEKIQKGGYTTVLDKDGNKINITYSSENLEKFRKDKFFDEFHENFNPASMKLLYIAFGLIALAFVAIVFIVALKK